MVLTVVLITPDGSLGKTIMKGLNIQDRIMSWNYTFHDFFFPMKPSGVINNG